MNTISILPYNPNYFNLWNQFIADSKNATFLFHRDFMEYHQDRFEDYSLLAFEGEKLVAVLPANRVEDEVHSHQGLTYGSLVYGELKIGKVLLVFQEILCFLERNGFKKLNLKLIPSIYHKKPAEEIAYLSFLLRAKLTRTDGLAVVQQQSDYVFAKDRIAGVKRGIQNNLMIRETDNMESFWKEILLPTLKERHQVKPVHTLEEIQQLKNIFPENIRQFNVYHQEKLVAGTTIFVTDTVAHSQYIASNSNKNELGSLDFLHNYLIKTVFKDKSFFDFGISNENQGTKINGGLSYWKESFGASMIIQNFYEINTENHVLLENVVL